MTFTATAPDRSNDPRVLGAAAITVLLWASAFIVIRGAGEHFGPGGMALLRMLVGSAALSVVVLIRHRTRGVAWPSLRSLPAVVVWGVAWFGVYNLGLNAAEQSIDAGTAAMLVNVAPLIVVVLAGFLLGEGFPRQLMLGVPVAFGGVVLIGVSTSTGQNSVVGVLLALAAAVLYGGSALAQKHLLRRVDPVVLTWVGGARRDRGPAALGGVPRCGAGRCPGHCGLGGDLPRGVPDGHRVPHLGLCARTQLGRQNGCHHLCGPGLSGADGLAAAGRGAHTAGSGGRSALSGRGVHHPAASAAARGRGPVL